MPTPGTRGSSRLQSGPANIRLKGLTLQYDLSYLALVQHFQSHEMASIPSLPKEQSAIRWHPPSYDIRVETIPVPKYDCQRRTKHSSKINYTGSRAPTM